MNGYYSGLSVLEKALFKNFIFSKYLNIKKGNVIKYYKKPCFYNNKKNISIKL